MTICNVQQRFHRTQQLRNITHTCFRDGSMSLLRNQLPWDVHTKHRRKTFDKLTQMDLDVPNDEWFAWSQLVWFPCLCPIELVSLQRPSSHSRRVFWARRLQSQWTWWIRASISASTTSLTGLEGCDNKVPQTSHYFHQSSYWSDVLSHFTFRNYLGWFVVG
jgi:hypothetical protein